MLKPIHSITDLSMQDMYKYTMRQAVFETCPSAEVEYLFQCRTEGMNSFFVENVEVIRESLQHICSLRMSLSSIEFLRKTCKFSESFLFYLTNFRPSMDHVHLEVKDGQFDLRVSGPWLHVIDWEIWILSVISELWTNKKEIDFDFDCWGAGISSSDPFDVAERKLELKMMSLRKDFPTLQFVDMGLRRAASVEWHDRVISWLEEHGRGNFLGTSNVYLANKYDLSVFGSVAHEWFSAHLGLTRDRKNLEERMRVANHCALLRWLSVYGADRFYQFGKTVSPGIMLTDTFGTDLFLNPIVFSSDKAREFDGLRHDSGDWRVWFNKVSLAYERAGVDLKEKTLIFSDSLIFEKMKEIYTELNGKCKLIFGIGTNLCNDLGNSFPPLNIVMKMVRCNGRPVWKLSDVPGKLTCDNR